MVQQGGCDDISYSGILLRLLHLAGSPPPLPVYLRSSSARSPPASVMASPLMEPLLGSKDSAFAAYAAASESSAVVDRATDAGKTWDDDGDMEADEMSSSIQRRLDESSAAGAEEVVVEEEEMDERAGAEADEVAECMARRLSALPGKANESEPFSIFRVAGPMRERNRHLYEPQMVSIGPFHRGADRLASVEEHKWRFLRDLLARKPGAPLAAYARAARAMEPRARRRYAEPSPHLPPREFAEMLLLDGCFIVEYMLKGEDRAVDALLDTSWAMQNVYNDLLLLENQLPFFVVQRFFDIATGGSLGRDRFVNEVLFNFLTFDFGASEDAEARRPPDGEIDHLLHLHYHWFLPPENRAVTGGAKDHHDAFEEFLNKPPEERTPWKLPSASELKDAGVTFRANKSARSLVDVAFHRRDGVLEIPAVENFASPTLFANLLAYEQSRGRWEMQRLVSYVLLMSSLVDAPADAEILLRAGVLMKAEDQDTAAFYSHLGELCPPPEFVTNCYADLYADVREHCGRSWNRHRAVLVHDYFSNPWTSMSAAAAVVLLILTVVQTIYTVLPYYHPN